MKLVLNPEFGLYERNGQAFCDSLQIAETFEKRHADVLNTIGKLIATESGLSEEFRERNFSLSSYKSEQNKKMPKYLLTKDGFTIVTFGYTGKKAMTFKEAYINRFNQMEIFIQSLLAAKEIHPSLMEAIKEAHTEPKPYHYSTEQNMIYRIVLGMDAKKYREQNGIPAKESIKPYLAIWQIRAIEELQRVDVGLFEAELSYEQRKEKLFNRYQRMQLKLSA